MNRSEIGEARTGHRWFVFGVFFFFMLLHQADKLLIGPLTSQIIDTFKISYTKMGAVTTGALIVGAIAYPLWGYLYDRYARPKLLALASFLWGATTWLNAIAPTFSAFIVTRASTGIDDSSYPGIYSLISDYFAPKVRGKIYGFLQVTQPIGYLIGMALALMLGGVLGWRKIFYLTGALGVLLAIVIFFGVKDVPRGKSEPELQDVGGEGLGKFHFEWKTAFGLFKKPSLVILFVQGFFGVFPWNVITYWLFTYMERERGYDEGTMLITMVPAVLLLAAGYPLGGVLGDRLFRKTPRGRAIVGAIGVVIGMILMQITINVPAQSTLTFGIMLCVTAIFIPFASPNVISIVYDVTEPEIRSTANATQSFIESIGSAMAPLIAGIIADHTSLKDAILIICTSTWAICFVFFIVAAILVPKDIAALRDKLAKRASIIAGPSTAGD